jgi:hypothetical protein
MRKRTSVFWALVVFGAALLWSATGAQQQDRRAKVLGDRERVQGGGFWIYNDLAKGFETARKTGKPLLVVFRCIPCEHCAQLDEQVVERSPAVQKLLEQFVCVRIVHANGMDLSFFQFDYDQSWTAFFLNADRTIYGRYGTRSHRTESAEDMSIQGFSRALTGALSLHREYPSNKASLAGKQSRAFPVRVPEEFPNLKGQYTAKLDYDGQVVKSCIHCHQVGESMRLFARTGAAAGSYSEQVLFPYPHPKILGLILDPSTMATVRRVEPGSPAERGGFRAGDDIVSLNGQPILSFADVQWVLHHAGSSGTLHATLRRNGNKAPASLTLEPGWKQKGDLSWRATSWDLRRMVSGGLLLEPATPDERRQAGAADGAMALRVQYVGQYGQHAAGKQAGFQTRDIIVKIDGHTDLKTETDAFAYLMRAKRAGDRVVFHVVRSGKPVEMVLPMQ